MGGPVRGCFLREVGEQQGSGLGSFLPARFIVGVFQGPWLPLC